MLVLIVFATSTLISAPSGNAATRPFATRFTQNVQGDVVFVANTLMTCAPSAACTTTQAGTAVGAANNNNSNTMQYIDTDTDGTTFNSSSAILSTPPGASILFAGLYWGGFTATATRNTVKFAVPGGAYQTLTASQLDSGTSDYQGFVNVTGTVAAAGNGAYTVANVLSTAGATNMYAGWTLVVAYSDPAGVMRNLTVFDGYQSVANGAPSTIPVSGFITPPNGAVNTKLGVVAYEGDRGTTGDQLSLNNVLMSDAVNPVDNFFNSSITQTGTNVASKTPNYVNQLGFDADILAVPNAGNTVIANGATTATIRLSSTGDVYYPGVVTFVTDLYSPRMTVTKTATDVNGGTTRPGDIVRYSLTVTNTGDDSAVNNVLTDPVPNGTTFVPGSLRVIAGPNAGSKTDAGGDDTAEFTAGVVKFFLGTGATSSSGGELVKPTPGNPTVTTVVFDVTVNSTVGDNVSIANTAQLSYTAFTLGSSSSTSGVVPNTGSGPVVNEADLSIVKTLLSANVVPGQTVEYELVVSNSDPGANSVIDAPVADTLPASLINASWTCTATAGSICATATGVGSIASTVSLLQGGSATYLLSATLISSTTGVLANTATVTAPVGVTDGDSTNNTSTSSNPIQPIADLQITKSNGVSEVDAGSVVTYSIVATNAGPSDVTGATVIDNPPFATGPITWSCASTMGASCPATGTGALAAGVNLPVGSTATFSLSYTVDPTATAGTIQNTASISPPTGVTDPTNTNDSATDNDTLRRRADLSITKTHPSGPVTPGTNITYTLTVTNAGPASAANATVTDTLPPGMTFVSVTSSVWTCGPASGQSATCTAAQLPAGVSTVVVVAAVNESTTGSPSNSATVSSPDDSDLSNNSADDATPLTPVADLSIFKSHNPATLTAGTNVTYQLAVRNAGPSSGADVVVTDALPVGLTALSATGPGWSCVVGPPVTCSQSVLPVGNSSISIVASVADNFAGSSVSNTATIASTTDDPSPGDRSSTDVASVARVADIQVVKSHNTPFVAGTPVTYTIVVTNNGPSAASGATLTDNFPAVLSSPTWSCTSTAGSSCPSAGTTMSNVPLNLASGGVATFVLTALLDASATSSFTNTATVASPSGVTDPNPGNNSSSDTSGVAIAADVSVTKTDGSLTAEPGSIVTYTITVANAGPSSVSGATVTDPLPATLTGATWTCAASAGSSCPASGNGSINTVVDLATSGNATFTLSATVDPSASGTLSNTATVSVPATVFDPNGGNNSATDTDTLNATTDLSLTKTDGSLSAVPGSAVTYTIIVSNLGPSFATNALVTDTMPTQLIGPTWTCATTGSGSTCPASGSGDISAPVDLAAGGQATFSVTGTIDSTATGSITNSALVTPSASNNDPNPLNNSASDTNTLTPTAAITITKTDNATSVVPGQNIVYTVVVTNAGPSAAPAVSVSDTLPAALLNATWTCTADPSSRCVESSGTGNISTTADFGSSGSVTYTLTARVDPSATGTLTNSASASLPTGIIDPDGLPNVATDTNDLVPTAELSIVKTDNLAPSAIVAGTGVTYTIAVTNSGPSRAVGVTVTDPLPTTLSGISWTCTATPGSRCATSSGSSSVLSTISLDPNGTATFTLTGELDSDAQGLLINSATVDYPAGLTDPTPGPTEATNTLTIGREADLSIDKSDSRSESVPGEVTTYVIAVFNSGPSRADGVTVTDTLSPLLTNATWTCSATAGAFCGSGGGSGNVSVVVDVPKNGIVTITVSGLLRPTAEPGTLVNTATLTLPLDIVDPNPANNSSTDSNSIVPVVDLVLTKTDSLTTAVAGSMTSYTITVTNRGPSAAIGARVVDVVGTALIDPVWTCAVLPEASRNRCVANSGAGNLDSTVDLEAGATATYILSGTINPSRRGSLVNTASVTPPSGVGDSDSSNNSATDTTGLTATADVQISKTNSSTESAPGETVTFDIDVTNNGPSTATSVAVTDPIIAPFSNATWTCNAGAGSNCPTPSGAGSLNQTISAIPPGSTVTFQVKAKIAANAQGTVSNTANATGSEADPDTTNNSATDTDNLVPRADLRIVKVNAGSTTPGKVVKYVISVFNDGPSDVVGATVADQMPSALASPMWACVPEQGARCSAVSGTGDISSSVDIASGSFVTFTVTAILNASLPTGDLTNTATVTPPISTPDPDTANNRSTDQSQIVPESDLVITKTLNGGSATPGEDVSYTITVTNNGPSDALGALVVDTPPPSLTESSWTCASTGGASCQPNGAQLATKVDLPVHGAAVFTLRGKVSSTATGVLTNTASITPAVGSKDPSPGDNSSTASTALVPKVDLQITKDDGLSVATPGKELSYKIVVTNNGPSASGPVRITDVLPGALINATWTCSSAVPCKQAAGVGNVDSLVQLDVGASASIEIKATVDSDAVAGELTNIAQATVADNVVDPTPGPTEATDTDKVEPQVDLSIAKTHGGRIEVGSKVTYIVAVSNAGPSNARGIKVVDDLPSSLTGATWTCAASSKSSCPQNGAGSVAATVNVASGGRVVFTITATVDPDIDGDTLTNSASLSVPAGTKDVRPDDNQATDKGDVFRTADVSVTKTDGKDYAVRGRQVVYTMVVTNSGPAKVRNVRVTDVLEKWLVDSTWICQPNSGDATCQSPNGSGDIDVLVDLGPRSSVVLTLQATLEDTAVGDLRNRVAAQVPSNVHDPIPSNNHALDKDHIWFEWLKNPPAKNKPLATKGTSQKTAATSAPDSAPVNDTPSEPDIVAVGQLSLTGTEVLGVVSFAALLTTLGLVLLLMTRRRQSK